MSALRAPSASGAAPAGMIHRMHADRQDDDTIAEGSIRGDGLATGSAPQGDMPDPDETVRDTARGGEGLATGSAPQEGVQVDVDEAVKGSPRGGEGLADDAG